LNLSLFVYNRLTGRAQTARSSYRVGMRLWNPVADFVAYRQLNRMGLLTFRAWIRSIMHPQIFPVFRWNDPLPAILSGARLVRYAWSRLRLSKPVRRTAAAPLHLSRLQQPSTSPLTTRVTADIHTHTEPIVELPRK